MVCQYKLSHHRVAVLSGEGGWARRKGGLEKERSAKENVKKDLMETSGSNAAGKAKYRLRKSNGAKIQGSEQEEGKKSSMETRACKLVGRSASKD